MWQSDLIGGKNSLWTIPLQPKTTINMDFIFDLLIQVFLEQCDMNVCHWELWHFASVSYTKINNSFPVITFSRKFGSLQTQSKSFRQIFVHLSICSSVNNFDANFAHFSHSQVSGYYSVYSSLWKIQLFRYYSHNRSAVRVQKNFPFH